MLHGRSASSASHFIPPLKIELEKMGYEVETPDLPNTDLPDDIEQTEFVKANCKLDRHTVIVGHSMGGVVALRLLEQGIKVNKVILISTPFTGKFLDRKDRPSVTKACQRGFDFETIIKNASSFMVLGDSQDHAVSPIEAEMFAEKLKVKAKIVKSESSHFCSQNEPEVLAFCTNAIRIFTTRLDTIFGATYLVLAPEHEAINKLQPQIKNWPEVVAYIEAAKKKTELERKIETKDKTGVELKGVLVVNPANNESIPVYVADYVLMGYGTGAIMAVPAHDERDWEFAKKFDLSTKQVIALETGLKRKNEERRDGGCGIIFDSKSQKYAVLEEEGSGFLGFCAGGLDTNKNEQTEVIREIKEESGLYDFCHIEKISTAFSHFYNSLKNVNRFAHAVCYLFILKSTNVKPTKLEVHEKYSLVWKDPAEIEQNWTKQNRQADTEYWVYFLHQAVVRAVELGFDKTNTNYKFRATTDYGLLINSEEFDGLSSKEAISKIAEKIKAKLTTEYRLRDWLISRQRYWGAPIPIIYCPHCIDKKEFPEPKFIVNCADHDGFENIISGKKHVVTRALSSEDDAANYAQTVPGDILEMIDNKTKQRIYVKVVGAQTFKSLDDLFKERKIAEATFNRKFSAKTELSNEYEKNRKGYTKQIDTYGLVAWQIELITKAVPVPEPDLPVTLSDDVDFRPHGESPLARSESFHKVKCLKCGASARRESDTMDTFVDSAWYFLRYADPHNVKEAFAKEKIKTWLPVNLYVGGAEHAVMHLLYARFITKVLHDLGYVDFSEPFVKLRNQGLIMGEDGQKMSKSRGNVVNPDEIVAKYGADTFRLYEMFLGPLEDVKPWNTAGIIGLRRFLERVWNLILNYKNTSKAEVALEPTVNLRRATAQTIKKVTADIEAFRFNTAISALMKLVNDLSVTPAPVDTKEYAGAIRTLLILLYPFAPHITAELWSRASVLRDSYFPDDADKQIWQLAWPTYHEQDLAVDFMVVTVQVNGRMRVSINCPSTASEAEIVELVKNNPVVAKYLVDKTIKRVIYVAGKLINLVVE
ncbi:MAG: alpha/beta fold hydrolase [Patescibacteria group bacterium]